MKLATLFSLIFLLCCQTGSAQQNKKAQIDSLKVIIESFVIQPDSLAHYAPIAYKLAEEEKYTAGLAFAAKAMGISSYYSGDLDQALKYYSESLEGYTTIGDSMEIGKAYYNLAMIYDAKADKKQIVEYGLQAIRIFDKLGDHNGQGRVYNLLGISASREEDYERAISYFKQYHHNAVLSGNTLEIATSLNNIGGTYTDLEQPDSALHYLYQALDLYTELGHRNLAGAYQNIGLLLEKQGKLDEAIKNLQLSVDISEKDNHVIRAAGSLYNLGRIYRKKDNNNLASQHLERSLDLSKELGDKFMIMQALEQLAYIKSEQGQFKTAFDYMHQSTLYKDSVYNIEQANTAEELKTIYETEKKEQEIENLNQQNLIQQLQLRQKNSYLFISIGALVVLALGSWLMVRHRRLKAEHKLQNELSIAILETEERERSRIASDLHDGVGQLLSAALLNLNQINKSLDTGQAPPPKSIDNAIHLVKNSYEEMREISHQMMPNALLKAGLSYSVREFLNKVDSENLKIQLDIVGLNERLPHQTEILLYRCIQESVNNVIKHAEATHLSIQLVKDTEGISISIEDNGKGFDQSQADLKEGIGLSNIRSRTALLKGTVDIDTTPGKGTLLIIYVPL